MHYRLLALLTLAGTALVAGLAAAAPQRAATLHQAGIVVQFGDGHVATACVAFSGPSITGFDLLQKSGVQVVAQTDGGNAIVCKIEQQGCAFPTEACFCQCPGGSACQYWAYWHLASGHWQFSPVGASSSEVRPGGVDGWAWGGGTTAVGVQPPLVSFDQICPVPAPATKPIPTRSLPTATSAHGTLPPTLAPTRPLVLPTANTLPPPSSTPKIAPRSTTSPPVASVTAVLTAKPTASAVAETVVSTATQTALALPQQASEEPTSLASVVAGSSVLLPTMTPSEISSAPATATTFAAGGAIQRSSPASGASWASYLFFVGLVMIVLLTIIAVRRRT